MFISKFAWAYFNLFIKKRDSLSKMTAPRTKDKSDIANSPELVQIKKFFADNKEEFRKNTELMSIAKVCSSTSPLKTTLNHMPRSSL